MSLSATVSPGSSGELPPLPSDVTVPNFVPADLLLSDRTRALAAQYKNDIAEVNSTDPAAAVDERLRQSVGEWFNKTGQADSVFDDRNRELFDELINNHGGGIHYVDLVASDSFVRVERNVLAEQGQVALRGLFPDLARRDLTDLIPVLKYLPAHLRPAFLRGIGGNIAQYAQRAPEVSESVGQKGGLFGAIRGVAGAIKESLSRRAVSRARSVGSVATPSTVEHSALKREQVGMGGKVVMFGTADRYSSRARTLLESFMTDRLAFVKKMGWLPNATTDKDRYDTDPRTTHILRSSPTNNLELLAGMRLTEVHNIENSLSWRMMDSCPGMQDAVRANEAEFAQLVAAAERGELWDLTRLVTTADENRIDSRDALQDSFLDLFGSGVHLTGGAVEGKNPAWLFLTTPQLHKYLTHLKIRTRVIASAKISPGDKDESLFCAAYPQDVARACWEAGIQGSNRDLYTYSRLRAANDSF